MQGNESLFTWMYSSDEGAGAAGSDPFLWICVYLYVCLLYFCICVFHFLRECTQVTGQQCALPLNIWLTAEEVLPPRHVLICPR